MIRVILADDHNIVRNGIRNLLEKTDNISIVADTTNGQEVLSLLTRGIEADIVLADMNMPFIGGVELAEKLKAKGSPVKVILLTINHHQQFIAKAFQAGVAGYLFKNIEPDELIFAIQHVYQGRRYICIEYSLKLLEQTEELMRNKVEEDDTPVIFSTRELSILRLMVEGFTNDEIADRLFTSKRTVEGYRQAMVKRVGVRNTPALIKYVIKKGLI